MIHRYISIPQIYGDKDADGFYRGECNGRVGFVPCNMVSEVQVEDTELAEQLLKECHTGFNPSMQLSSESNLNTCVLINADFIIIKTLDFFLRSEFIMKLFIL